MVLGQRVGYVRVSTDDQNTERQLAGVRVDRIFEDRLSGKNTDRPKLQEMLSYVRDGDTIVVHSMDRLARNLDDLRRIVSEMTQAGIRVEFVKESMVFTGEDSPMARLLLSMMGAFAEFERSIMRERQREGIAIAKRAGKYKGRKRCLSHEQAAEVRRRAEAGENRAALAAEFGIGRTSIFAYLRHAV